MYQDGSRRFTVARGGVTAYAPSMAGSEDEEDDETLIADLHPDDESTEDGETLVGALAREDGDATLIAVPQPRLAPPGFQLRYILIAQFF